MWRRRLTYICRAHLWLNRRKAMIAAYSGMIWSMTCDLLLSPSTQTLNYRKIMHSCAFFFKIIHSNPQMNKNSQQTITKPIQTGNKHNRDCHYRYYVHPAAKTSRRIQPTRQMFQCSLSLLCVVSENIAHRCCFVRLPFYAFNYEIHGSINSLVYI